MVTAIFLSCLLVGMAAEAKKSIVAVFNIKFKRVRMTGPVRDGMRDFIETKLAASGSYEVVPPERIVLGQWSTSSFSFNSKAMRSSPHSGCSAEMRRMNSMCCFGIRGLPGLPFDFQRQ